MDRLAELFIVLVHDGWPTGKYAIASYLMHWRRLPRSRRWALGLL